MVGSALKDMAFNSKYVHSFSFQKLWSTINRDRSIGLLVQMYDSRSLYNCTYVEMCARWFTMKTNAT